MRILFMGTPDFAVASLKRLVADGHDICGVFTQPDKPKNRGMKLIAPPVKEYALTQGLHVYQPLKMKDGTALELVRSLAPELIVVAAYGRILPEDILNTPKYGAINVHSSILPKYRGAAPINWAILNGDAVTGVSIMYMAPELDAGDVILCRETAIDPDEDAVALTARLAELGAEALHEAIGKIESGTVARTAQDHAAHTYAPMLDKSLSPMDFSRSAQQLHDQVRGLVPWPSASMVLAGKPVKVHRTAVGGETSAPAGSVVEADKNGLAIACGDGRLLRVLELQGEGGKRMAAADYLRGAEPDTAGLLYRPLVYAEGRPAGTGGGLPAAFGYISDTVHGQGARPGCCSRDSRADKTPGQGSRRRHDQCGAAEMCVKQKHFTAIAAE